MHPAVLRELAAEHVRTMTAIADDSRLARRARRAAQPRTPVPRGRPRPSGPAEAPGWPDRVPAADGAGPCGPLAERITDADARDLAAQQTR